MRRLPLTAAELALAEDGSLCSPGQSPLAAAVESALGRPGGCVLLGAFGSGKTHLVDALAREGLGTPVPLRLLDPTLALPTALERIIGTQRLTDALEGRTPLLLDGLDEAPHRPDQLEEVFEQVRTAVGPRWLLTSRPGYFRTEEEAGDDQLDSLTAGVPTLVIEPLPHEIVRALLLEFGGVRLADSVVGLPELATSPMLLHVVAAALPHIELDRPIQAWGLFDAWIRGALSTGRGHNDVVSALEALAWHTVQLHDRRPTGVRFQLDDVEAFGIPAQIRSALMVTDLDGAWRFGHRSVLEFLFAGFITPRIADNQGRGPDALSSLALTDATRAFLVERVPPMPVRFLGDRVRIPRGNFIAGGLAGPDERPLRIQHLPKPVWIAREPASNAEWSAFHGERPRQDANYLPHWGADFRCPPDRLAEPVYGIWPEDADAFARSRGARLPTADEWEKAVRGIDGRRWPWGDQFRRGQAVTAELHVERPLPSRAFGGQGVCSLFGAVGGVFEYTSTAYRGRPDRGRVVMGGCFSHQASASRPSLRLSHKLSGNLKAGVRLAWSADEHQPR